MIYPWFKGESKLFLFKELEVAGDQCVLITPSSDVQFTDSNKIYRSSIWRVKDGFPVSLGFKKFMNFYEQPGFEPVAKYYDKNFILTEKIDGSCLIISKYKGEFLIRTRGSFSIDSLSNSSEVPILLEKYGIKKYFGPVETADFSLIFEWVSPKNQIILKYEEPDLFLIGKVYHSDYSYATQEELNIIAHTFKFKRPRQYEYSNINSYIELTKTINSWTSLEGVVIYFNNGQLLKKIKSDWYCNLHKLKSNLSSIRKVAEHLYNKGYLNFETFDKEKVQRDFYEYVEKDFDYEIAEYIKPTLLKVLNNFEQNVYNPYMDCVKCQKNLINKTDDKEAVRLLQGYPSLDSKLYWLAYRKTELGLNRLFKLLKI